VAHLPALRLAVETVLKRHHEVSGQSLKPPPIFNPSVLDERPSSISCTVAHPPALCLVVETVLKRHHEVSGQACIADLVGDQELPHWNFSIFDNKKTALPEKSSFIALALQRAV